MKQGIVPIDVGRWTGAAVPRPAGPAGPQDIAPAAAETRRPRWELETLGGRLGELSGRGAGAQLSLAFSLVAEAQRQGEPAAWITTRSSTFFPPDAAACGIRLDQLPVVFVPDAPAAARAADKLVRSGGFGLVVLDLALAVGADPPRTGRLPAAQRAEIPPALLSRLVGLAQQHEAAVLFLTEKPVDEPSLGSLVSLRCEALRQDAGAGRFLCRARALKDKRHGPGWSFTEVRRGPLGLR